jgi:hypothetical protein
MFIAQPDPRPACVDHDTRGEWRMPE